MSRFVCRLLGHKWRQPYVATQIFPPQRQASQYRLPVRECERCGVIRRTEA